MSIKVMDLITPDDVDMLESMFVENRVNSISQPLLFTNQGLIGQKMYDRNAFKSLLTNKLSILESEGYKIVKIDFNANLLIIEK